MAIAGYGGGVYLDSTKVAEIANWSLDMSADDIDITSFDSEGWRERIQGIKEWSGSFEGNFSVGKNLFDFKNKGIKTTDYSVDLGNSYRGLPIQLSPNTTYTVQRFMNGFEHDPSYVLDLWHQQGQILNLNVHSTTDAYATFTTDNSGLIYLRHRYATNDKLIKILKQMDIMLQTGTQATGYEPYPDDTQGQAALINAWLNGEKVKLELQVNASVKFSGDALITPSIETPVDDKASFSCDFSGTGPLTPIYPKLVVQ